MCYAKEEGNHFISSVLYGRAKKPVAKVSKIQEKQKRVIGTLDGIASFYETDGGKITMEEFLGMDEVEK